MRSLFPGEGDAEDDDETNPKPIKLGAPGESSVEVKLTFPPKYNLHLPIGVEVKRDYADYHVELQVRDGTVYQQCEP